MNFFIKFHSDCIFYIILTFIYLFSVFKLFCIYLFRFINVFIYFYFIYSHMHLFPYLNTATFISNTELTNIDLTTLTLLENKTKLELNWAKLTMTLMISVGHAALCVCNTLYIISYSNWK